MRDWMKELEEEIKDKSTENVEASSETEPSDDAAVSEDTSTEEGQENETNVVSVEEDNSSVSEEEDRPNEGEKEPRKVMIPKARLDEEIEKRRRLEDELKLAREFIEATLKQTTDKKEKQEDKPSQEDIISALYKKEYDALLEGDVAAAMQYRRQADIMRADIIRQNAVLEAQNAVELGFEQTAFAKRLNEVVQQYPVFLETSDDYDQELTQMALNIGNAFKAQGMNSIEALDKTIQTLKPLLDARYANKDEQSKTPIAPLSARNVASKVATVRAQPPSTQKVGAAPSSSPKIDVMSMTVEDFEKLSQEDINKLLRAT